ncbi:MAG: class I SAM-dependent methyltransferase [Candidatus Obscuribacterales bacterium]|nr:class I SAM-dependent methyltransferase [Candidatus Obscuribacterales bacterium]
MRTPYQGLLQVISYNWPMFVISLALCLAATAGLLLVPMPAIVQYVIVGFIGLLLWLNLASTLAAHWVYDRSVLNKWTWLKPLFPNGAGKTANICSGLYESDLPLQQTFPGSVIISLDIYDALGMTAQAQRANASSQITTVPKVDPAALPFADGELDNVFMILSAHEIRQKVKRDAFFQEIRRVLKPGGKALLVEHHRDLANFTVFGPAFFHFLPKGEWLRLAALGGLEIEQRFSITPFVQVFLLRKRT